MAWCKGLSAHSAQQVLRDKEAVRVEADRTREEHHRQLVSTQVLLFLDFLNRISNHVGLSSTCQIYWRVKALGIRVRVSS